MSGQGLMDRLDGSEVTVAGTIRDLERRTSLRGRSWAIATVDAGPDGSVEVIVFPQTYGTTPEAVLAEGVHVVVHGRVNHRDGMPAVYALQVTR